MLLSTMLQSNQIMNIICEKVVTNHISAPKFIWTGLGLLHNAFERVQCKKKMYSV